MENFTRAFTVSGNVITDSKPTKKAGNAGENIVTSLSFTFSSEWDDAIKSIVFKTPKNRLLTPQTITGSIAPIPQDALDSGGTLQFSLMGAFADSEQVIRTPTYGLDVESTLSILGGTPLATYANVVLDCQTATQEAITAKDAAVLATERIETTDAEIQAAEAARQEAELIREGNEEDREIAEAARVVEFNGMVGDLEAINTLYAAIGAYGDRHARRLGHRLKSAKEWSCVLLQGDSTGNDEFEWFKSTMNWLATKHPAMSFEQRLWSDAHQNYSGTISYIQTGAAGDGYVAFNGISGKITTPDAAALRITGDLEVAVKYSLDDWVKAGAYPILASKFGAAGNRSWALMMSDTAAKPALWWSPDGTNLLGGPGTAQEASAAIPIADGDAIWIKCTLDVDNGAGGYDLKYYTSPDGVTWTQLGVTRTGVGTTSLYASTSPLMCGMRETGGDAFAGKFYRMILRSGIGGKIVASPTGGLAHPLGTGTMKDAERNVWTITGIPGGSPLCLCLNASTPGKTVAYSKDSTRFAAQTPVEPTLAFTCYGHNEGVSSNYQSNYEGLALLLKTAFPNVGIVFVTQNPQKAPRTAANIVTQATIQSLIAQSAAANDYGLVDVYAAIMDTGDPESYVQGDGVHPTLDCDTLWATTAKLYLLPAIRHNLVGFNP